MKEKYSGLPLQEIAGHLRIDQFLRLCSLIDTKHGVGKKFDILRILPFMTDKNEPKIKVEVLFDSSNTVTSFEINE